MPKPTLSICLEVMHGMLDDLGSWAETSSEGFTESEQARFDEYALFVVKLEEDLVKEGLPHKVERMLAL
ncbi:hypothetical protein HYPP_02427 [Hyphomicrobium sp. ghe19]|nr:hypothetical protein HYPP_02427 [Hyphomicrobium sp. ghe19]